MLSITDSPSARAVASTVPATNAGRAVRTAIRQNVRQRLTPSASEPSSHPRGTDRSPSAKIAIMIGEIITVRITHRRQQAVAAQLDHRRDAAFWPGVIKWLPMNGTSTSTPINP